MAFSDPTSNQDWLKLARKEPTLLARGHTLGLFLSGCEKQLRSMNAVDPLGAGSGARSHRMQAFTKLRQQWQGNRDLLWGIHLQSVASQMDTLFPPLVDGFFTGGSLIPPPGTSIKALLDPWFRLSPDVLIHVATVQQGATALASSTDWGFAEYADDHP